MSEKTKISWCDSTLNFWEGCTKVSDGCKNCYAEARDKRFTGGKLWGKGAARRKSKSAVKDAFKLNRKPWICECGVARKWKEVSWNETYDELNQSGTAYCSSCHNLQAHYHHRRIFSLSLGDWLDAEVPVELLAEMLDTIRQCDQVTWILCTKRPENFADRLHAAWAWAVADKNIGLIEFIHGWAMSPTQGYEPPPNIILLTSIENQAMADKRIPELMKIPAAWRGLSLEPLLGPVQIYPEWIGDYRQPQLDWLICGGESGAHARPCNVDWIRSLVEQGKAAGVAMFVKQLGSKPVMPVQPHGCDGIAFQNDNKGGDPAEWPEDLRVREWPKGF